MWTICLNIDHTTAPLNLWKEHNLHSDPSIICYKMNLQCFVNTSMKTLRKGSFDIPSLQLVPRSYSSRKRMALFEFVLITMGLINSPSRNAPDLKVVGPTQSCQGVHQDRSTWNIQLGVHLRR